MFSFYQSSTLEKAANKGDWRLVEKLSDLKFDAHSIINTLKIMAKDYWFSDTSSTRTSITKKLGKTLANFNNNQYNSNVLIAFVKNNQREGVKAILNYDVTLESIDKSIAIISSKEKCGDYYLAADDEYPNLSLFPKYITNGDYRIILTDLLAAHEKILNHLKEDEKNNKLNKKQKHVCR